MTHPLILIAYIVEAGDIANYARNRPVQSVEWDFAEAAIDLEGNMGYDGNNLIKETFSIGTVEGVAVASPSFTNSNDLLHHNSKKIIPISGYEDVVVHGDMYGFVFKNADGAESIVSVREFAMILKESGLYNGGDIRLISCETGKAGSVTAQGLANELGVSVLAPSDIVYIYPDGKMIVSSDGYTNDGVWIVFSPGIKP